MTQKPIIDGMADFIAASPTPFHAVANMAQQLRAAGFEALDEGQAWALQPGRGYFVVRNGSSIIAFRTGTQAEAGIQMVGAHTDSPCLKVKPNPAVNSQGYFQLGVEVYGGVLLAPWFDRDLSLAGRVSYLSQAQQRCHALINFERPIALIPSLAIHLDREVNKNRSINPQTDIPPVLAQLASVESAGDFHQLLIDQLVAQGIDDVASILDYDLCFYDTQKPATLGLNREFFVGARLDNLASCYAGLRALLAVPAGERTQLLVCNDHEEVGSASCCGAAGPMLRQCLERLYPEPELRNRVIHQSLLISADNAHGIHPNFADKHEQNHGPLLNKGPVIKINANQRYATTGETSAYFRHLCQQLQVPVQAFVVRTDMACGSTIGPITSAEIGVATIDVGLPTWGMHSIRETAGSEDLGYLIAVLQQHFAQPA